MPSLRSSPLSAAAPAFWRLGEGAPPQGAFVALVPGAEAPLLVFNLPPTLKGPARAAVARRQVLDRLGPGHTLRVPAQVGWTRALVVPDGAVVRWRAALGTAAARCKGLLPDYLALPVVAGGWCIATDASGLRVRMAPDDGFSAEHDLGLEMLARALELARTEGRAPKHVLRQGSADAAVEALLSGIPAAPSGRILAHDEGALDLLRDQIAPGADLESRLRGWLLPAALVLIAALGWVAAQGLALGQDRARTAALAEATLASVRRDLIPDAPIVDLQLQVLRAIEDRRAPVAEAPRDPLDLLRRAAGLLSQAGIDSLDLGPQGLSAVVRVDGFSALDTLLSDLAAQGLSAEAQRPDIESGGGVSVTLLLTGGAP